MRFSPGTAVLSDIANGVLAAGTVPVPRFTRSLTTATNPGIVAVLGAYTEVAALGLVDVVVGDLIITNGFSQMLKGGIAGISRLQITQAGGTGTIVAIRDLGEVVVSETIHSNGITWQATLCGVWQVIVGGNVGVALRELSGGSNGTIAAGDGQLLVWIIPGS